MARQMGLEDQEGVNGEDAAPPAYEEAVAEISGAANVIGMRLSALPAQYKEAQLHFTD